MTDLAARRRSTRPAFDADVVVIGGGPAGAAMATHLADRGFDTIVLDQHVFPRDKICGDFLSPHAVDELRALRVPEIEGNGARSISRAVLHLDGHPLVGGPIPRTNPARLARVVRREQLDYWVLERARRAGARILEGQRAVSFVARRGGVEIKIERRKEERRLRARLVVGADGSNSMVAPRVWRRRPSRDHRIMAVRGYFSNVCGPSAQADLYFTQHSFPGYCWLFPLRGGFANVGVGVVRETYPREPMRLTRLLRTLCDSDESLARRLGHARAEGRLSAWPLTTYCADVPLVADRVVLIGDAAGLINPLNGEGIQYALQSARWAAEVVSRGLELDRLTARDLAPYERCVRTRLGPGMSCANVIMQLIRYRRLNAVWLLGLEAISSRAIVDASYAEIAGGALSGVFSSTASATPQFAARTLDEALRVIRRAVTSAKSRPVFDTRALDDNLLQILSAGRDGSDDLETWSSKVLTAVDEFVAVTA